MDRPGNDPLTFVTRDRLQPKRGKGDQAGSVEFGQDGEALAPLMTRLPVVKMAINRIKALLRGDSGIHPAVLHHVMRRTEAEIVHMIGNIGPAMYYARRNDQHVTDLQLDFA